MGYSSVVETNFHYGFEGTFTGNYCLSVNSLGISTQAQKRFILFEVMARNLNPILIKPKIISTLLLLIGAVGSLPILVSCGKTTGAAIPFKNSTATSTTTTATAPTAATLAGTYTACISFGGAGTKDTVTFTSGGSFTYVTTTYQNGDTTCSSAVNIFDTMTLTATYTVGDAISASTTDFKINYVVQTQSYTLGALCTGANANASTFCGYADWTDFGTKSMLARTCDGDLQPAVNETIYGAIRVNSISAPTTVSLASSMSATYYEGVGVIAEASRSTSFGANTLTKQ